MGTMAEVVMGMRINTFVVITANIFTSDINRTTNVS